MTEYSTAIILILFLLQRLAHVLPETALHHVRDGASNVLLLLLWR